LDDLLAALTAPIGGDRPPRPEIQRSEKEMDSRPPEALSPDIGDGLTGDPFAADPFINDELQFDFGEELLSVGEEESSWLDDPSPSPNSSPDPFGGDATSSPSLEGSDDDSIQPAERRPEHLPSRTPSGRPASLQPYEELSFDFSEGDEVELKLDQIPLEGALDEDDDPDLDESVDRARRQNKARWSKPP
jgi:hypothetical protein